VTATFQNAAGKTLDIASIGPVTAGQRGSVSSLVPQAMYGTVPAGAVKVVVNIKMTAVSSGNDNNGEADDLSLTIGGSAKPAGQVLQTVPYDASAGGQVTIDPTTGLPLPPAGGLYRPAGVSASNGVVYASNTGDNVVAALQNGQSTAITGSLEGNGDTGDGHPAANATLYQPYGTAEDAKGDVFIADAGDDVVREITPDGNIHVFAGNGTGKWDGLGSTATHLGLDHPDAVAVDASGDVFIADTDANRVIKVLANGKPMLLAGNGQAGYAGDGGAATEAALNMPAGLAVDPAGNVYIADSSNNVIRRVDAKTKVITTVAGNYAADKASDGLGGFSGDGGPATSARLNDPQGVAVDGAGDLFVADTFNNAIREVTPDGTISTVVNSASANGGTPAAGGESSGQVPTASHLNTPFAVAVDPSTGVLYIADTHNNSIAEVIGLAKEDNHA
jgi:sugar lactone lactonase YvrE